MGGAGGEVGEGSMKEWRECRKRFWEMWRPTGSVVMRRHWKTPRVTGCSWVGVYLSGFTAQSAEPLADERDTVGTARCSAGEYAAPWPVLDQGDIYCCKWSSFGCGTFKVLACSLAFCILSLRCCRESFQGRNLS